MGGGGKIILLPLLSPQKLCHFVRYDLNCTLLSFSNNVAPPPFLDLSFLLLSVRFTEL